MRTYIGFAIRANEAVFGLETLERAKRPPKILIIDKGAGENTKKGAKAFAEKHKISLFTADDMTEICTKAGVKLIGIREPNLARAIEEVFI